MGPPLTLLTYNVRHAVIDDGADAWERRRPGVLERIRAADPDVLALQECAGEQHRDVARGLPAREWVGVADDPGSGEHNPVGHGPRLRVLDAATAPLSASGDPGSVGWDAAYPRVLTAVDLRDRPTGRELRVLAAHFDHVGTRARVESARLVRERADAVDRPVAVVGDLNTRPGRDAYELLVGAGEAGPDGDAGEGFRRRLVDARSAAREVSGPATTLTDFESLRPGRRIDHVLVTPEVAVERYAVDATRAGGRFPSDHLPVVVELGLPAGDGEAG